MKKSRRKNAKRLIVLGITVVMLLIIIYLLWVWKVYEDAKNSEDRVICDAEISVSESDESNEDKENKLDINEYPEELIELLQKNPETEENLTELEKDKIPLLMQWDSRWGYYQYGDNVMGLTGCGPTCLSMVASYLFQNPALTPLYMAKYATRNGYSVSGSGTSWDFMSAGATDLGLRVQEVPLMESKIKNYLQQGYPIICIMGPGEFTDNGHFIVLTGVEGDKIRLNDPNSRKRSERLWEYEELKSQIRNIWVYQK